MTTDATVETPSAHGEPPRHSSPLLARRGAVRGSGPDDGVAWHYGDPTAEQRALSRGGAVVHQSHLGVVTVTGPDRLTWLNSITSQELTALAPRTSTELLVLSPQGHVEAPSAARALTTASRGTTATRPPSSAPCRAVAPSWTSRTWASSRSPAPTG